jgi:sterol O-acyltransferase
LLHEACAIIVLRQVRPVMMVFMLVQLPVILMTRYIKSKRAANLFFWWGTIIGLPLIINFYLRFGEFHERGLDFII